MESSMMRQSMRIRSALLLFTVIVFSPATMCVAQTNDDHVAVKRLAIEFLRGVPRTASGGVGIYLGTGFAITAAHVTGQHSGWLRVGGQDAPASLIKFGYPAIDLALFRVPKSRWPS